MEDGSFDGVMSVDMSIKCGGLKHKSVVGFASAMLIV